MENFSPWKRKRPEIFTYGCSIYEHTFRNMFDDDHINANIDLDIDTKRAALKVSPSVVSLVSLRAGTEFLFAGSGTIIDSKNVDGKYLITILTSASLVRSSPDIDDVPEDIKLNVYLPDDKLFEGQVSTYDFHYNVATIKIESDKPLQAASLRLLDDALAVDSSEATRSFQLHSHSKLFKLSPGETVVAIGRFYEEPYELMAAPGKFSVDCCNFDCKELFRANCKISKAGIGGPLINRYGEVVGVNFYDGLCTPFLPINIASKCLEHFNKFGKLCSPWLGLEMTNLYAANLGKLEAIIQKFPNIFNGVFVEEVTPGSPAHSAGLHPSDVIVKCGKDSVHSFLEFFEKIWDKVGESVELVVIRESTGVQMNLSMVVGETTPDKFNRWPIPEECMLSVKRLRTREDDI